MRAALRRSLPAIPGTRPRPALARTAQDARPLLAHTRYQYAALLLADGRPAERSRASELLDAAHADAEELGLARLAEQVLALRAANGRPREAHVVRAAIDISPRVKHDSAGQLTRREREVVALVARGLSNREIGETLVISERTAEMHVGNLLGKLGLTTHAQAAAWAARRGEAGVSSPCSTAQAAGIADCPPEIPYRT